MHHPCPSTSPVRTFRSHACPRAQLHGLKRLAWEVRCTDQDWVSCEVLLVDDDGVRVTGEYANGREWGKLVPHRKTDRYRPPEEMAGVVNDFLFMCQ